MDLVIGSPWRVAVRSHLHEQLMAECHGGVDIKLLIRKQTVQHTQAHLVVGTPCIVIQWNSQETVQATTTTPTPNCSELPF